jgi:hypothetical protein
MPITDEDFREDIKGPVRHYRLEVCVRVCACVHVDRVCVRARAYRC